MMHYTKGENIEKEIKREELPFEDCFSCGQKDFLWMHVKGGTKVNNVVSYAKNALDKGEHRTIVWTGAGGGLVKTVSCAEIIKRTHPLYQVTRMCYTSNEEHWLPQMDGLDEIIVNRKIPCLHILMSLDEISENTRGLQKPNTQTSFFGDPNSFAPKRNGPRLQNRNQMYNQRETQNKDNQEGQRKKFPRNNAKKSKQGEKQSESKYNADSKSP